MLKAYFISSISKEQARVQFENRLRVHKVKLKFLNEKYDEMSENIVNIEFGTYEFCHYLVLTRARVREIAYVKWLEDSLKYM